MKVKKLVNGEWTKSINVRDFVLNNVTSYYGNHSFLTEISPRTKRLWKICIEAMADERKNNGVRAIDTETISTIGSFNAGTDVLNQNKSSAFKEEQSDI